ncbi:MAG: hypothetical protein IPH75_15805 [bacterium]|nr:hypothetical protein [bacterium]
MKKPEDESPFNGIRVPQVEGVEHQQELKIPLLRYRKSSRAGLWLLAVPIVFALTVVLKYELGVSFPGFDYLHDFFDYVSANQFLTILIPIIFVGLPLLAMTMNFLAICHFASAKGKNELLITIKWRPVNLAIFLLSFAVLIYYVLPDNLP